MNNLFDLRTILLCYLITNAICTAVIIPLYFENRRRSPELIFWPATFLMHFTGLVCITLRGSIPDFFSIIVGNVLLMGESLVILIGLERYFRKTSPQYINYAILAVLSGVHIYFTYAQPSLLARSHNFSAGLLIYCSQVAWLLLHRVDPRDRPTARLAGILFLGNSFFSLVRIIADLLLNPGNDFFRSGLPDTLIILVYQMLYIGLSFALFMIVNRRLVDDLEDDIRQRALAEEALRESEEKFSKAFHNVPEALVISMSSSGKILAVNDSFEKISGFKREETIGRSALEMKMWGSLAERESFAAQLRKNGRVNNLETVFHKKDGQVITCLLSGETIQLRQGECFLLIIHDITERKKIEQAALEQRVLAEALRDTANALNSTLEFDEVLDRILANVGRVTPHETANIMVLEEDGSLLIVRGRGYVERGGGDLTGQCFSLAEMPILQKASALGRPVAVPDTGAEPLWRPEPSVDWVKSYAVAPILIRERTIGFLNLESAAAGFFTQERAARLQAFADQASIAIQNARLYEDVQELAITDALTGLFNRRGLFQLGEREVIRSVRFQHPLAVLMLDIDHFKAVNDTYGHLTGDRVLAALAACLRSQIRNVDLAARYGGEEFTLLLPETDLTNASAVAERIRLAVENLAVPAAEEVEGAPGRPVKVTVSLGLVSLKGEKSTLAGLIAEADQALFSAKKSGRNRVMAGASAAAE